MEQMLDQIAEGKADRLKELKAFWKSLSSDLKKATKSIKSLKGAGEDTGEKCDLCGKANLFIKWGRYGKFIACGNYPECKNTRQLTADGEAAPVETVDEPCPVCGSALALKSGRFGEYLKCVKEDCGKTVKIKREDDGSIKIFREELLEEKCPTCGNPLQKKFGRFGPYVACSKYKNGCDYIQKKSNRVETGALCPKDGGSIDAITFRGRVFYGCRNYPKCDFRSSAEPLVEKCRKCGSPYLVKKSLKRGAIIACPNKECDYERSAA
jgi:DNA topoisomerase-1